MYNENLHTVCASTHDWPHLHMNDAYSVQKHAFFSKDQIEAGQTLMGKQNYYLEKQYDMISYFLNVPLFPHAEHKNGTKTHANTRRQEVCSQKTRRGVS